MKRYCTDCRHYRFIAHAVVERCYHPESRWLSGRYMTPEDARSAIGECGPKGVYFEKREPAVSLWRRLRRAVLRSGAQ